MIDQLKPYPTYKDSGVEWLGKVPAHWNVAPLKRHFRLVTDRAITKRRAVALENIEGWSGRYIETEGEFQGDGTSFETDDLLFGKLLDGGHVEIGVTDDALVVDVQASPKHKPEPAAIDA